MKEKETRPDLSDVTKRVVWAAAAGRCTFCNRVVFENDDLGEAVPIGELAHNVGWGKTSPRGNSTLTDKERAAASNLLLLCRTCHTPIDADGIIGRYTITDLERMKRDHEARIRRLTAIGGDRKALLVRVVGPIRGASPELMYDTILDATTAAGYFPQLLPSAYRDVLDLDLRDADEVTSEGFRAAAHQIDIFVRRIHEGVRQDDVHRLVVFGFARISLLIHLGARLDDKVETIIFQRHRVDGRNAWRWPDAPGLPPQFTFRALDSHADGQQPVLILNVSGTVPLSDLPEALQSYRPLYILEPTAPANPGPSLIDSPAALAALEQTLRGFFAFLERTHDGIRSLPVLGALPVSAAITLGRVLMPQVSPVLEVFDRGDDGAFFLALEVTK